MTYNRQEARKLLENKLVVVIGDSIQRGVYKDMVTILHEDRLTKSKELSKKGEPSHCCDQIIEISERTNAKTYREVRQYQTDRYMVRFYFVTRIYSDYMETVLLDLSKDPEPDVVLVNSCLWDMSRYGVEGDEAYKENLQMFFSRLDQMLPEHTLVIWISGMPVSDHPKAGVLPRNLQFLGAGFPSMVRVANFYAAQVVRVYERDYLDAHFDFCHKKHLRVEDGVHWDPRAHRYLTNMILTHVASAWQMEKPRTSILLNDMELIEQQFKRETSSFTSLMGKGGSTSRPYPLHRVKRGGYSYTLPCRTIQNTPYGRPANFGPMDMPNQMQPYIDPLHADFADDNSGLDSYSQGRMFSPIVQPQDMDFRFANQQPPQTAGPQDMDFRFGNHLPPQPAGQRDTDVRFGNQQPTGPRDMDLRFVNHQPSQPGAQRDTDARFGNHQPPQPGVSNQGFNLNNQLNDQQGVQRDAEYLSKLILEQEKLISQIDQAIDRSKAMNRPGSLLDQNQNQIIHAEIQSVKDMIQQVQTARIPIDDPRPSTSHCMMGGDAQAQDFALGAPWQQRQFQGKMRRSRFDQMY